MALEKLTITAYKKPDYSDYAGKFTVLINPESYRKEVEIKYAGQQSLGSSAPELRYIATGGEKISFKLVFDGTGLIATAPKSLMSGNKVKPVSFQIEKFRKVTSEYWGSIHRPYYLQLSWGTFLFKGVLVSLGINYKLFDPNGTPLRAEADVVFTSSILPEDQKKKKKNQSPDVTHIKTVRAGDRLPALCAEIYDDPNYFVQVAAANQLNHLRHLRPGKELSFPPIINK
ncbi:CIS tube protein [Flavilitoribacter nigricans]|uniref:Contractile injection system tube protein N-terminal domain-containing protein n=1 Tax=Flavilitoribacter nigricans (strain ATCC 23147 / DSM 23189 / NBRC 102662 / NCIMB 1420 / SS-2) TaxID=1122177 RepID=A0A2D0N271_FLAN2|nr:hypothetical protein [Flavilitoribacter nigricans]PHN02219.1 hypothetical protein CRP01_33330 [Flavilitoribacter nigricans DSM 23189 = NBRC 102662]